MKKLLAILLVAAMVSVLAVSVSAEAYTVNSETLEFRDGSGTGFSIAEDGKTIVLNQPTSNPSAPANWSNAQLMVGDDAEDGFTVKIKDIVWDNANDNAVTIVYSNAVAPHSIFISGTESNFTLLVRKDGSIVFWGNACNPNYHIFGMWAGIYSVDKTLGETVTEFTYSMVPNADKSVYSFYVNDLLVYEYDIAAVATVDTNFHGSSILANIDKPCNFGFLALNGTGDWGATGWGAEPVGTLSYTIEEVDSVGVIPSDDNGGNEGGNEGGNQGGNEGGNQGGNEGGNQGGNEGGNQGGNPETGDNTWAIAAVAAVALMGCGIVITKKKSSVR